MTKSIADLRIYGLARGLEEQVFELAKKLPTEEYYGLIDSLRRESATVVLAIAESYQHFNIELKLRALCQARAAADAVWHCLSETEEKKYAKVASLQAEYTNLLKQTSGLIRYLKQRQEQPTTTSAQSKSAQYSAEPRTNPD